MLFKKIIFLLLMILPSLLSAQRKEGKLLTDSLLSVLPDAKDDTNKVRGLNTLSRGYYETDLDTALKYGKQALGLAEKLDYKNGAGKANNILGGIYYLKGNNPEALKSNTAALKLFQETGNKVGTANCYLVIGNSYTNQDNYPEAFKNYFAALKIYEETKNHEGLVGCYENIGTIYHSLKNDSEAMIYYTAGMKVVAQNGNKGEMATYNINIGNVYFDENNFTEALTYYNAAFKLYREIDQKNGIADSYSNIASVYKELGRYDEAMKYYILAAKLLEDVGNKYNQGTVYGDIGFVLDKQKKYAEAGQYFNKQLATGKETGALLLMKDAYSNLSGLYAHTGKFEKSLETYKSFIAARDSVFNQENAKKNMQAQMQYDFDKKESAANAEQAKKDAALQLKLQRKNFFIYGACVAFIALLVIGTLLFRQTRLRANQQKAELEQKQLRAQMNPHFIFNCLNSIQHFIVAGDVKNANKYLSGFALLMRQTLENSKEEAITLRREIEYLENYLVLERMRFEDKFSYRITCTDDVNKDRIEIPSMIIQPFIENAVRHGLCYLEGKLGILEIKFFIKDNYLYCLVDDNGIGRAQSHKLKMVSDMVYESQGMELTRRRLALVSRSAGAEYRIEITDKKDTQQQSEGTTITIKFPLES